MPSVIITTGHVSTTRTTTRCSTCGRRTIARRVSAGASSATSAVQSFTCPPSTTTRNAPCSGTRTPVRRNFWTRRGIRATPWSGFCKRRLLIGRRDAGDRPRPATVHLFFN